jgi:NAD(P)-dependent dehydrogenase (short-subunit alcohol dehydrogenase family)
MECAKAGITVNAIVPVAATAMTATIPAFAPHVGAYEATGEPFPAWLRQGEGFGTAEDVAGLAVYLASDASAGVTGQCIGIGGDRLALWSHPQEVAVAFRDGGWGADDIAATWPSTLGRAAQTVGIPAPRDPEGGTP